MIEGERVLITGASRGIGFEFARQYARQGARVFASCRSPAEATALAELSRDHGEAFDVLCVDVTDRASVDAAVDSIAQDEPGHLDIVVNNAGVSPRGEAFSNLEASQVLSVLEVNAVAPVIVAQRCIGLLGTAPRPRVVNVSSSMGSLTNKDYGHHYSYASSKAALNMLTRAAAHDLADQGVIVVALHPGWVRTDLGGPHAALDPATSVDGMISVIDGLCPADSSYFWTWQGEPHPW